MADGIFTTDGPARIIVPLVAPTPDELRRTASSIEGHPHDIVEWRVDTLRPVPVDPEDPRLAEGLALVRESVDAPVLATVRTTAEGGAGDPSEASYSNLVPHLAALGADAVDVEIGRGAAAAIIAGVQGHGAVAVASHHDFRGTPPQVRIRATLERMASVDADVLKVAYMPHSEADVDAVLEAQAWAARELDLPVIAISMGALGRRSRIIGRAGGSAATFATVGEGSAPGQLSAEQVRAALDVAEGPRAAQ